MTTLIAIPYWGVSEALVNKAVTCALANPDAVVLVAGDGQVPPVTGHHDRLVVGTFPTRMWAPATQQAMLLGSPFSHYAPHGADDWVEPNHVASLLALRHPAAGSRVIWHHRGSVRRPIRSSRTWIEFGVFETAHLRAVGGYNAAEPCGQDSVLISVLLAHERGVKLSARPTYHKVWRADSLTQHPSTRGGSALRTGVRERNRTVLNACAAIGWRNTVAIRAYRDSLVPPNVRSQLEDRVALVERWLA